MCVCDAHPHMFAWLIVHDSPYYAVTDERGAFRIDGVPPGSLKVTMWHEGFRPRGLRQGRPAPALRPRRAPGTNRRRRSRPARRPRSDFELEIGDAEHVQAHLRSGRQLGLLEPGHRPGGRAGAGFGARLTGCHVYAARLHDYRFKQMEYTLPEEYKDETELERQRKIHDSLIAMGLQLISESYLDVMQAKAEAAGLAVRRRR